LKAQDLHEAFSREATQRVRSVEMLQAKSGDRGNRAIVEFLSKEDMFAAQAKFDGGCINNQIIQVRLLPR